MRVLFLSGIPGGTRRYRCEHHQEQLALLDRPSVLRTQEEAADAPRLYADVVDCDLVILHRVDWDETVADLVDLARMQGKPVVFETDDLFFDPDLAGRIAILQTASPAVAHRMRLSLQRQARTFQESDCVLTTTRALAAAAEQRGKPALIHRNAASQAMIGASELVRDRRRARSEDVVTLGYFSGSASHDRDFAVIAPVLYALLARHPHLHLIVAGPLQLPESFEEFSLRVRRAPFTHWQDLPSVIGSVDINLAPLELDNIFCQAKSEIKWMEAALVGVPTIASATDAFRHAIENGETGLLASTADEWQNALSRLIADADLRRRMGETACRSAYAHYAPEMAAPHLLATLQAIQESYASAPGAGNLAHEVAQRMGRHLERVQQASQALVTRLNRLNHAYTELQEQLGIVRLQERNRVQHQLDQQERERIQTLRSLLERLQQWEAAPVSSPGGHQNDSEPME